MSKQANRTERLNRIQMQLDAIRGLCDDVEIAAKFSSDPSSFFDSEAYADFLDAVYDLTEIDAVYEASVAARWQADRTDEIAECRRRRNHLRADILERGLA